MRKGSFKMMLWMLWIGKRSNRHGFVGLHIPQMTPGKASGGPICVEILLFQARKIRRLMQEGCHARHALQHEWRILKAVSCKTQRMQKQRIQSDCFAWGHGRSRRASHGWVSPCPAGGPGARSLVKTFEISFVSIGCMQGPPCSHLSSQASNS